MTDKVYRIRPTRRALHCLYLYRKNVFYSCKNQITSFPRGVNSPIELGEMSAEHNQITSFPHVGESGAYAPIEGKKSEY